MRTILRTMLRTIAALSVAALLVPVTSQAQNGAPKKIPAGIYSIVPNPGFTGEVDVSAFSIRIEGDTSMVVEQGGTVFIRSKITGYNGDEVTWTDAEGQLSCPGTTRYKFAVDEASGDVRLTPVEDSCPERSGVLAQVRLVRQK
jgi:hypothetical protein